MKESEDFKSKIKIEEYDVEFKQEIKDEKSHYLYNINDIFTKIEEDFAHSIQPSSPFHWDQLQTQEVVTSPPSLGINLLNSDL